MSLGEGSHSVEWIFWSDGGVAAAWLDEVSLPGDEPPLAETQTTPEPWTDVTDVTDLDASGYRFFKVKVRMKE